MDWLMTRFLLALLLSSLSSYGAFFQTRLGDLKLVNEEDDKHLQSVFQADTWRPIHRSQVPLPRFSEFALVVPAIESSITDRVRIQLSELVLVIEMPEKRDSTGFIDLWSDEKDQWVTVACEVDAAKLGECKDDELVAARAWDADHKLRTNARGGLWYRSQVQTPVRERNERNFDDTFATLSGGRAIAENLALDRDLILGDSKGEPDVEIATIQGVTVEPIPWEERMPEGEITVDELSKRVPEDQYLMMVPSLRNLLALMDRVEEAGTPFFQAFASGDQYRGLPSRYRRQMGLDLPDVLARMLPVKNVGVTGGDPFFPTGSAVAVLLETDKVDFVYGSLAKVIEAKAGAAGAVKVGGEGVVAFENEDRTFSSHLAVVNGAVVLANSASQIERLKQVEEGKIPNLGASAEYRFFRHRYPLGAGESAYVFISDACLRDWAGPKVRIAASRRNRALAALGQVTAGMIAGKELRSDFEPLLAGVKKVDGKVISERYGSLGFLTPVSELEITKVTAIEKQAYERWRRGYEGGWAKFFDPIAIRLNLSNEREEVDMTILPLRVDSDYAEVISLVGAARLSEASRAVAPESVFHFAMAIDHESEMFKEADVSLVEMLPGLKINPLSWMGESFAVSFEDSLAWQGDLDEEMLHELPVLLRFDVQSRIKLALFLTSLRGMIEGSSPDLLRWETREFEDQKYVAIGGAGDEFGTDFTIYYATLKTALLVTLSEDVLKRAMVRERAVVPGKKSGEQVYVKTSPQFVQGLGEMSGTSWDERRSELSWRALPILNEWRKSKGAADPMAFHQAAFANLITCPGGKGYRWNDQDLTMESVAYGHPGSPRYEGDPMEVLKRFKTMSGEATFEEGGMRMNLSLDDKSDYRAAGLNGKPRPGDEDVVALKDLFPLTEGMVLTFDREQAFFDDEPEKSVGRTKIISVTGKEGVTVIVENYLETEGDEDVALVRSYEVGPKGGRMVSATRADWSFVADPDAYDYPAELWPGMVFRVRKNEGWIVDKKRLQTMSDAVVSVEGWEKVVGPGGDEFEALKITRMISAVSDGEFNRSTQSEWLARGIGPVKTEEKSEWSTKTFLLKSVVKP